MSSSNCCFLTCIQIFQEAGQVVWYSHLFKNFPFFCYPHKDFSIVNEAEVDVFLEFCWFFNDPVDVGNFISGSSPFSKSSLNIWKFSDHIPLKLYLEKFEHYFASVWNECSSSVVWTFFGITLVWYILVISLLSQGSSDFLVSEIVLFLHINSLLHTVYV